MNRANYSFGGAFFPPKEYFRKVSSPFFISHRCNLFAIHYNIKEANHIHLLNGEVLKKTNTPTKNEKRNRIIVVLQKLFISL